MRDTTVQSLADALAESLMTMAFLDAVPAEAVAPPPAPLIIRVAFSGARRGALEILTSESLGVALVANMLGTDPDDPDAAARGRDALKELANVACGLVLAGLPGPAKPAMAIPTVRETSSGRWDAVTQRADATLLDIEGLPLAARVRGAEQ